MYIGGHFSSSDNELFMSNGENSFDRNFPLSLAETRRFEFQTGTDSLASIVGSVSQKKSRIFFPRYFCEDSIARLIHKLPAAVQIYRYENNLDVSKTIQHNDILITCYLNCYDPIVSDSVKKLHEQLQFIWIEDFVQSPLEIVRLQGDFAFNSLRKFLGIDVSVCYTGRQLSSDGDGNSAYYEKVQSARLMKANFQLSASESMEDQYLKLFETAEENLFSQAIHSAHVEHLNQIHRVNFEAAASTRRANHDTLKSLFSNISQVSCLPGEYMYLMCKVENRDALRSHCFRHGIFPAIHWPGSISAKENLSFHIDQRYCKADMNRTYNIVKEFYGC